MELQTCFVLIFSIITAVQADKYLNEKPAFLSTCKLSDANFNKCISSNFQTIFVEWKNGLPGLSSVGKLDPLLIKRVRIAQDNSRALALNLDLTNLLVSGASTAVVQDSKIDTNTWKIDVKIFIPKLNFDADYKVKGHVLNINLNSEGKANFVTDSAKITLHLHGKLRDAGDLTFYEIESSHINLKDIGGFHLKIDNLFHGQKELEDSANVIFNENWRELYESLKPAIVQTISKVIEDRLQKIFHFVPASYFISDIPKAADVYG